MAEIIKMPRMSDTMEEGVLVVWHKKVGDKVSIGELLAEIETDKATMDFESPAEGVLLELGVKEGESVPIDAPLAIIGKKGEDVSDLKEKAKAEREEKTEESEEEKDQEEKEEEKKEESSQEEQEDKPEEEKGESEKKDDPGPEPKEDDKTSSDSGGRLKASPLAKKLAKDKGIDIEQVKGSGDNGRIIKRDIENFKGAPAAATAVVSGEEGYEDIALSNTRKTIAKKLAASKFSAPHFYLTMELDMGNAITARKSINEVAEVKVSFNDMIVKAAAAALRKHPKVNASWNETSIRKYQHIHMGIAVAQDDGLVVPVIRFADQKSLSALSSETKELAEKARNGQLKLDEMQGSTFTISNLGMFDIDEFTAIINPPAACILAVGTIKEVPVVVDGEITVGSRMKVTLSCDHRTVDGATGAQFLQTLKAYLEDPVRMLA